MVLLRRSALLAGLIIMTGLTAPAVAASYPERPIRVVIPYTAGGVAETAVRLLAVGMERKLGHKLIIEAKPGAAGNLGTIEVARADPDGYTILVAPTNNIIINQFMSAMPIDPLTALTPVAKIAEVPLVLFSNPAVSAQTLKEFVSYVKANPGKTSYGTPSSGSLNHLLVERLKHVTGMDIVHVPFRGTPQAVIALLTNEIQLFPIGMAAGIGHLKEGKLTALAVATEQRSPMLPDVPTVIESGFPGFTAMTWWAMLVPAGTPDAIIKILQEAIAEGLKDPTLIDRFKALGMIVPSGSREDFMKTIKSEAVIWRQTIEKGGIRLQ